jgi:hypothetical protein
MTGHCAFLQLHKIDVFLAVRMGNQSAKVSNKSKFGDEPEKKSRTNWTAGKTLTPIINFAPRGKIDPQG